MTTVAIVVIFGFWSESKVLAGIGSLLAGLLVLSWELVALGAMMILIGLLWIRFAQRRGLPL